MFGIIGWILFGAIVGMIATKIAPGEENLGCLYTVLLGIAGSFVGGFMSYLLGFNDSLLGASGWIFSIIGSVTLCLTWTNWDKIKAWFGSLKK